MVGKRSGNITKFVFLRWFEWNSPKEFRGSLHRSNAKRTFFVMG